MGTVQTTCTKWPTVVDCVLCSHASFVRHVVDCACHSQGCATITILQGWRAPPEKMEDGSEYGSAS